MEPELLDHYVAVLNHLQRQRDDLVGKIHAIDAAIERLNQLKVFELESERK